MSRPSAFGHPLLIGFDGIEQALDRLAKAGADGYPPYNIVRFPDDGTGPARLRITVAVAGFRPSDLDVVLEGRQLAIRGRQGEDERERDYLHRGIAARQFARSFVLAEGMDVTGATLADGLLSIDLVRPEPARTVRRIPISSRASGYLHDDQPAPSGERL